MRYAKQIICALKLSILFLVPACWVQANEADSNQADERLLEELTVTASRVEKPLSSVVNTVTIIDNVDLEKQLAVSADLSGLLGNMLPSFSPSRQKLTSYGESMRGRAPLYLIDGIPQSNPLRNGARDSFTIDPLMLERVEVIHGANAIHGMGASGGIINLITKKPAAETVEQTVRFQTGFQEKEFNESLGYGVNYSISGASGNFDGLASASYRYSGVGYDADGNNIGFDTAQGDTMNSDLLNLFLKGAYNWDNQRFEVMVNQFSIEGGNDWVAVPGRIADGVPTTAKKGQIEGKPAENEVSLLAFSYTHDDFFGQKVRLQAFDQDFAATYGGSRRALVQDPAYGSNIFDQSQNNSEKTGFKLTLNQDDFIWDGFSLVYGLDVLKDKTYQALIMTGRNWVPETEYFNYAPFAQLELNTDFGLTLTTGIRHEKSQLTVDDFTTIFRYNGGHFVKGGKPKFSETLYNLGATYKINSILRIYANYAEGFSMPDVGRVLRAINVPNQNINTFIKIKPIVTENYEIGTELGFDTVNLKVSYYQSQSDYGQRLQLQGTVFEVTRQKTDVEGVEFNLDWAVSDSTLLKVATAVTKGQYDSDGDGKTDTDLGGANMSPNRLNLIWEEDWGVDVSSRLQINYLDDRKFKNASGAVSKTFDGYTSVDASVNYNIGPGTLQLGIHNLTNTDYFTYYAQTLGRDTKNFKGMGRSYSLSYAMSF